MSDFAVHDSPTTNAAEFTVSEISAALKRTVEDSFGNVRVRGEVSGYRGPHSSGHCYFSLKDERSRIEAVIWKGTFSRLRFRPEEGMEVIAQGRLTTYPGSSKYQIVIDSIEPAGAGALMALLEERKKKLAAEGLFEQARKRPLPYLPRIIGVVTSPTGAVIRDIIHRISDRFPMHVLVWPVRVQGDTTGAEVSAAVRGFNEFGADPRLPRPDVIIVARGGGSLEDLWGFNDEAVVRAVATSDIPVISAVGHETDWTLVDLAADMRAPTPTGAAELAVPVKAELEAQLANLGARLRGSMSRNGDRKRQALRAAARALPSADQLLALPRRRFDEAAGRLERGLAVGTERKRARLGAIRLTPSTLARRIEEARRLIARDLGRMDAAWRIAARAHRREIGRLETQLPKCTQAAIERKRRRFDTVALRLVPERLARETQGAASRLSMLGARMDRAFAGRRDGWTARLAQADRLLMALSHQSVLERGFALVRDASGNVVKRAAALSVGQQVSLQFADGAADALVTGEEAARPARRPEKKKPETGGSGTQGQLF